MKGAKFADVAGIRTRYFEAGQGEPLVLVHGGQFGDTSNAEDWGLNFDQLAKYFHVFGIDKPGQGFSDNPQNDSDYVIGTTVSHAYNFLKVMGIAKANLAGHSRGGYTVCRLALEHPEVVKSIVIVDSATLMWEVTWYAGIEDTAPQFETPKEHIRYRVAANSYSDKHITDEMLEVKVRIQTLPTHKTAAKKMEALNGLFLTDLAARVEETHRWIKEGELKCPTLLVWGFEDPSASFYPVGLAAIRLLLPNVPNAQVHIFNKAGHPVFRERTEEFNSVLTGFIKSC